jgi:hypothetical protein
VNPEGIRGLMAGTWAAQAVYVAARLDIAEQLSAGPKTSRELAETCGADSHALYRVMRALAGLGVFHEEDDRFSLTPVGRLLTRGAPGSLRSLAIWNGEVSHRMWTHAVDVVKDGTPAPRRVVGSEQWQYLAGRPELRATFDDAMAGLARQTAAEVLEAVDLSRFSHVVDVGGGNGTLLAAILDRHPHVSGVLFDRPETVSGARANLARFAGRCEIASGDFLVEVPRGADLYILSSILHDWDDDTAVRILRTCRDSISPASRLLIVECVLCSQPGPVLPLLLDLHMLVMTGGRERTDVEYERLLDAAQLEMESITPLPGAESVVMARPVEGGSH